MHLLSGGRHFHQFIWTFATERASQGLPKADLSCVLHVCPVWADLAGPAYAQLRRTLTLTRSVRRSAALCNNVRFSRSYSVGRLGGALAHHGDRSLPNPSISAFQTPAVRTAVSSPARAKGASRARSRSATISARRTVTPDRSSPIGIMPHDRSR